MKFYHSLAVFQSSLDTYHTYRFFMNFENGRKALKTKVVTPQVESQHLAKLISLPSWPLFLKTFYAANVHQIFHSNKEFSNTVETRH